MNRSENRYRFPLLSIFIGLLSLIQLIACSGAGRTRPAPPVQTDDLLAFHHAWVAYANEVNGIERQRDCAPRLIPANPNRERRGAVVMFHGFGGCPQQFFTLAAQVAAQGYDVLLPLQPGHGMLPDEKGGDDLSRLPQTSDAANRYGEFAIRINSIMAHSPGEKIVVGFSLGGAVALNASLNAPDLYDRQLLLSPMLAIRGGAFVEGLVGALGRTPGLRNLAVKHGSIRALCHGWQDDGRAGFCNYRLKDTIALLTIEDINQALNSDHPLQLPIQVIAAGAEKYVSNTQIAELVAQQREHGPVSFCTLPVDVPHEMLSPYENTGRQMYWLEGLLAGAVGFIVEGRFIASEPKDDKQGSSVPDCRLNPLPASRQAAET